MITLLFCITKLIFVVFWIVVFLKINSSTIFLKYFNHFKYINLGITSLSVIVCIFVFKLNFDKLFLRFQEGQPLPVLDKVIFGVGIELFFAIFVIGFIYSIHLNVIGQEMSQISSFRLFDIPFLILVNYLAFVIEYLSFRYFLFKA